MRHIANAVARILKEAANAAQSCSRTVIIVPKTGLAFTE